MPATPDTARWAPLERELAAISARDRAIRRLQAEQYRGIERARELASVVEGIGAASTSNERDMATRSCRHHHRREHETGWRVVHEDGGMMRWTSPAGHVLRTLPERPFMPVAIGEGWIRRRQGQPSTSRRFLSIRLRRSRMSCGGCSSSTTRSRSDLQPAWDDGDE
jgi:hypothetical protein